MKTLPASLITSVCSTDQIQIESPREISTNNPKLAKKNSAAPIMSNEGFIKLKLTRKSTGQKSINIKSMKVEDNDSKFKIEKQMTESNIQKQ